jgi:hypothetical protein
MTEICSTPFCGLPATEAILVLRETGSSIEYPCCGNCAERLYRDLRGKRSIILWRKLT